MSRKPIGLSVPHRKISMSDKLFPIRESDKVLLSFYQVDNLHSLIDEMEKHIEKLQEKALTQSFNIKKPRFA